MSSTSEPEPSLRFDPDARLPAAWALAGSLVVAHVISAVRWADAANTSLLSALFLNRSTGLRALAGGQYAPRVDDEPWRLIRSVWLHADALHLLVNAIAVVVLGRLLEPWVGPVRFLFWFALSGGLASIASHAAGMLQSDGASGGAYGLLGAVLVLAWRHRSELPPEDRGIAERWLPAFVVGNLVLSLILPFVDAVGHVGGLLTGILLGAASQPHPPGRIRATFEAAAFVALAAIALFGPSWTG